MANVTSVKSIKTDPDTGAAVTLIVLGVVAVVAGISGTVQPGVGILGGLLLLAWGALLYASLKPTYWLVLGTAGGETQVMFSQDPRDIEVLVTAITNAIIARG